MINRLLNPPLTRSFFLFGARSTGKSTLLQHHLPPSKAIWIDLLDIDQERELAKNPGRLEAILAQELKKKNKRKWVVIDEVQKLPEILSLVHRQIQKRHFRFALTGSSARKLKRGQADLLAGRASWLELFPLTHIELAEDFDLDQVLNWGSLPEIVTLSETDRARFLKSYCSIYLKEEVIAEQIIRKVQPFREFLELVAMQNSQIINYSRFAKDCNVDTTTIQNYFDILKDTLLGIEIPPFHYSVRKRQRKNPKFYLFDCGVTRALAGLLDQKIHPKTSLYGKYFEQFIILEIYRLLITFEKSWKLSYLTTKDDAEIDLIIDQGSRKRRAIEIKSTDKVNPSEIRQFQKIGKDIPGAKLLYISQDPEPQRYGSVECLHWKDALKMLFR